MRHKHKDIRVKMQSVEPDGTFKGYAAVFGNVDSYGDIIKQGAFRKTIQESRGVIPILSGHSFDKEIGLTTILREDGRGLYFEGKLYIDNDNPQNEIKEARDTYIRMKRREEAGIPLGMSIGYRTIKEEREGENNILHELQLFEISTTPMPANEEAYITGVKTGGLFDSVKQYVASSNNRVINDSEKDEIEFAIDALKSLLLANPSSEPDDSTPGAGVADDNEPGISHSYSGILNEIKAAVESTSSFVRASELSHELERLSESLKADW